MQTAPDLFGYRRFWAKRFGIAPFLPMSRAEMDALGWDSCDVVLVTGDAYIDHPSFGMALVGRLLEAQGFRVGIIAQPDWRSSEAFAELGASLRAALANWRPIVAYALGVLMFGGIIPAMILVPLAAFAGPAGAYIVLAPDLLLFAATLHIADYVSSRDIFHAGETLAPVMTPSADGR